MKSNKFVALLLALAMLLSLAACAGTTDTSKNAQQESEPATVENETGTQTEGKAEADGSEASQSTADATQFDAFPHPKVKTDGKLKIGVVTPNLTSESLYRWDWQFQIECAHRGWEYISFQYQTDDNYETTFQSALNQDVDALILLNVASAQQWSKLYDKAREQGVGVYTCDQGYGGYVCGVQSPGMVMMAELLYRVGSDYNWDLDCAIVANDPQADSRERIFPLRGFFEYETKPNMTLLDYQDISPLVASLGGSMMAGVEVGKTWMQKYGEDLECIFSYGDNAAMGCAEAIMAAGNTKTFCVGIDGGRQCWSYIRNGEPVKYSYAQGFEYQAHTLSQIIEQIQVQGLNPGDDGCDVSAPQSMIYVEGNVVTIDNVPDVGTSIHQAFAYYDESVTDPEAAWWNWTDGPGIYLVEAYEG